MENRQELAFHCGRFTIVCLLPVVFCLLFPAVCPLAAYADAVYLKNGKVMTGKIVEKNDQFIVLKFGAGTDVARVTIFHEDVSKIESEKEYAQDVAMIPFALKRAERRFEIEGSLFKKSAGTGSAEGIRRLVEEDARVKSLPAEDSLAAWSAGDDSALIQPAQTRKPGSVFQPKAPEERAQKTSASAPAGKTQPPEATEVEDLYYRKFPLQEAEFILVLKNGTDEDLASVLLSVEINGERFPENGVKVEDMKAREEREVDIASVYKAYAKWSAKTHGTTEPERALKFRIYQPNSEEAIFEKILFIF